MAGVAATSPTQTNHVSRPIPAGLVPAAVLLAAAVGLLALLPSLAQAVWEVPHLVLLGLVVSLGVFTQQRNAADSNGGNAAAKEGGALAWNARYHPDHPLVVVADHAATSGDDHDGGQDQDEEEGARERPISLPVRRLKPAAKEPETGSDGGLVEETETDSCASSSSGFWAGARAGVPSPPSVLDADLGLSPCAEPQPQQQSERHFSVHSANSRRSRGSCAATPPSTVSRSFVPGHYHPSMARDQTPPSDDGEVTDDWDEDADDGSDDVMTHVWSEMSVRGGDFTACAGDHDGGDDTSVDEELHRLATKAVPDGEEEVDRKADEFIAKFREQIRLQRH